MEQGPKIGGEQLKKEISKEEFAKFQEAWETLTPEEKEYLGGYYHTTDIEKKDEQLKQTSKEKLGKFGFSVGSELSNYIDKFSDANYWTKDDVEDFKKWREQQKK